MKIKTKILIIIVFFSIGLILSGGAFMSLFYFDMLEKQEILDLSNKSGNLVSYVQDQAVTLESTLNDWAKWDDTYAFVSGRNRNYIRLNLTPQSVKNLNMSFIAYFDGNGMEVYKLCYDRENNALVDFPPGLTECIDRIVRKAFDGGSQYTDETGIFRNGDDAFLFACTSVTDSAMTAEPAGVMIAGRRFDGDMLKKMGNLAGGEAALLTPGQLDSSILSRLNGMPAGEGGQALSVAADSGTVRTYVKLDLNGAFTGTVLEMTGSRDIFLSGLRQYHLILISFLVWTALFILVLLLTLDAFISKPLVGLVKSIGNIKPSGSMPRRLEVKGKGELAVLSGAINGMLDSIEENYREIGRKERQFNSLVGEMKQGFAVCEVVQGPCGKAADCRYLYANESFKRITGIGSADIAGKSVLEAFPQTGRHWLERFGTLALSDGDAHIEESFCENGRYLEICAYRSQPLQCVALLSDVTERRLAEEEREYASYHDRLTGLYNRRYFEEALHRLDVPGNYPLSVVIGDLNGLKFTNDAFGHEAGDRLLVAVADIIRQNCRREDIIARWGGDEFTLLLPGTSSADVSAVCARIRDNVAKLVINSTSYTMTLGYETKRSGDEDIHQLLMRAEDFMYRRKMSENLTGRGNAIHTILTTFQEKNEREREHSARVSRLCRSIAGAMGFTEEQAADMEIAGLMHDIGKIAVRDSVVNKKGMLNEEEWAEMKQHPEIGCRILCASNEMQEIAGYILAHHERWDGSGYPKGLAGREIPLQARIIAVADSYDAITSMRPYRKQMDEQEAVAELVRCSGLQFDPAVVRAFVEGVLGHRWNDFNKGILISSYDIKENSCGLIP